MPHEIDPVLRQFPRDCQPQSVRALGNAGGFSGARFWHLTTADGPLLLRRWPPRQPSDDALRQIHAILSQARARGVSIVPVPRLTENRRSWLHHAGHKWELTPWLPGKADYRDSPSSEKLQAAMVALAHFHVATADFPRRATSGTSRRVAERAKRIAELQQTGNGELRRAVEAVADTNLKLPGQRFVELIEFALPLVAEGLLPLAETQLPAQPAIRDVWRDHVLFTDQRVTGLVDFGALEIETPMLDVARLLGSLAGSEAAAWQLGITAYTAVRAVAPAERQLLPALDMANLVLGGCNWLRWVGVERRCFEDSARVRDRFLEHLERIERLVQDGPACQES